MNNDMIYVTSASDQTLVIYYPDIPLSKTWTKRGQKQLVNRDQLILAYYHLGTETLFKQGLLITDDEAFLKEVGLMDEEGHKEVNPLNTDLMKRMISVMPVADVKEHLKKMTRAQIDEFGTYAIENYKDLKNDRIDLISKATGRDIFKCIVNLKASQED